MLPPEAFLTRIGELTLLMSSLGCFYEDSSLAGALVLDLRTEDAVPLGIGGLFWFTLLCGLFFSSSSAGFGFDFSLGMYPSVGLLPTNFGSEVCLSIDFFFLFYYLITFWRSDFSSALYFLPFLFNKRFALCAFLLFSYSNLAFSSNFSLSLFSLKASISALTWLD